MTVGDIVMEPMVIHGFPRDERADRVRHLLRMVGLNSEHANRYPHEFSGGQRQRIGIEPYAALLGTDHEWYEETYQPAPCEVPIVRLCDECRTSPAS